MLICEHNVLLWAATLDDALLLEGVSFYLEINFQSSSSGITFMMLCERRGEWIPRTKNATIIYVKNNA